MKPPNAVAELVEALKHPVLGGEKTTETLLQGIKDRFPDAPGADKGLYPNLAWIKSNYPNIDLESLPSAGHELPLARELFEDLTRRAQAFLVAESLLDSLPVDATA